MRQGLKLGLLAGSAEAREIATAADAKGVEVRALISEPSRGPDPMPVPCTLFDFDDLDGVTDMLRGCDAVIDASHGFDGRMSQQGVRAARALELPFLSYVRPGWVIPAEADMRRVATVAQALPHAGKRVFSATGWASLPDYAPFAGERLFLRQTSPHDRQAPYDFVELTFGTPPFSQAQEQNTFEALRIDTLICRDLGGRASYPKVAAALALEIRVILIARPAMPDDIDCVDTVDAALQWLDAQ